jgi:hypothetical protein
MDRYINIYQDPRDPVKLNTLSPKREWMKDSGAYHCPPMMVGNTLGWYFELEESITLNWDGNPMPGSVKIKFTDSGENVPVGFANDNFGSGVITFSVKGRPMFETPDGYGLMVYGPTNSWIDGIQSLTGIVETDWSAFPFPMNWKMTATNKDVIIPKGYPIMCFIPINLKDLESFVVNFNDINSWSRLEEVKRFQNSRPQVPHLEQDKVNSDTTSGLYSKGIDLNDNKVRDRKKTLNLFKQNKDK